MFKEHNDWLESQPLWLHAGPIELIWYCYIMTNEEE